MKSSGKSLLGRGNGKCKGSEYGMLGTNSQRGRRDWGQSAQSPRGRQGPIPEGLLSPRESSSSVEDGNQGRPSSRHPEHFCRDRNNPSSPHTRQLWGKGEGGDIHPTDGLPVLHQATWEGV